MALYVLSDTHFNHDNIIDHCDRPFDDAAAMNEQLQSNWNAVVDPDDTVLFLGDLAVWSTGATVEWAEQLNGELILVIGNHDSIKDPDDVPFKAVENYVFTYGGTEFYCEHRPIDVPDGADWWHLYGHHHNNDLETYPFIDPERRRVNLSAELVEYTPLEMDTLIELLETGERYESLSETP